jgi:hypothetical protein
MSLVDAFVVITCKLAVANELTNSMEIKPFVRSHQLYSYSKISQHFMEPESSLPCSEEPSTGPYPEPDKSNPYHPILSKIHFIIVHPHMS